MNLLNGRGGKACLIRLFNLMKLDGFSMFWSFKKLCCITNNSLFNCYTVSYYVVKFLLVEVKICRDLVIQLVEE